MTIELLSFPWLIRKEILANMGFTELFDLATTSQRMNWSVKNDVKIRHHKISFAFYRSRFRIEFFSTIDGRTRDCIYVDSDTDISRKSNGNEYPLRNIGSFQGVLSNFEVEDDGLLVLNTYWSDLFEGIEEVLRVVNDIFSLTTDSFEIDVSGYYYQEVVEWAHTLDKPFENLTISGDDRISEVYEWVLDHPTTATTLCIKSKSINDETIGRYIRTLKAADYNPNLKMIDCELYRNVDLDIVLNGLEVTIEEREGIHRWVFQLDNGGRCFVRYVNYEYDDEDIEGIEISIERI